MAHIEGHVIHAAIDASHYQGASINWADVKAALSKLGPDPWAYVKASQGSSTVDAEFVRNFHAMLAAELNRGAYHYMDDSSPKTQAQHFAAVIVSGGFNVETDVAVLDLERSGFSQVITHEHAVEFVTELRALMPGIVVGIYLGMGYAGNGTGSGLSHAFDFWILAHYTHTTTWPTTFTPALEDGNTTGWAAPHVWQCSQSMRIAGIPGAVDADVSLLGFHELLALGGDMPLTDADASVLWNHQLGSVDPNDRDSKGAQNLHSAGSYLVHIDYKLTQLLNGEGDPNAAEMDDIGAVLAAVKAITPSGLPPQITVSGNLAVTSTAAAETARATTINVSAAAADPIASGKAIEKALIELKRKNGGKLGFE